MADNQFAQNAQNTYVPAQRSGSKVPPIAILLILFVICSGVLVGLLLPAVQGPREAAKRMHCTHNLKHIALALHNYHDQHKAFPPAYTEDENGNRLHSWRTRFRFQRLAMEYPIRSPRSKSTAPTPFIGWSRQT